MRTPGLTLALVLTIAVGIGSNVSVYAFGRGLTQSNSPLIAIGRIVSMFAYDAHHEAAPFSYDDYLSLKRNLNLFEWIGAVRVAPAGVAIANESSVASVAAVTSDLARALNLLANPITLIRDEN